MVMKVEAIDGFWWTVPMEQIVVESEKVEETHKSKTTRDLSAKAYAFRKQLDSIAYAQF